MPSHNIPDLVVKSRTTADDKLALARSVLSRMEDPEFPGVYVLGCFASPVTFSSQQHRAFNLIWALFETGRLKKNDRIAIVGGGLAGMTAAAAAVLKECQPTLIERASLLCHLQAGNYVRYLHPNILSWPEPGSTKDYTSLPILNWNAASVERVLEQIHLDWDSVADKVTRHFGYNVHEIRAGATPRLTAHRLAGGKGATIHNDQYRCIILAVGFGVERSLANTRSRSYWDNDHLHQPVRNADPVRRFLVSGCGDGGLIETLRLRLKGFDHERFTNDLVLGWTNAELEEKLRDVESAVKTSASDNASEGEAWYREYETVPVPATLTQALTKNLHDDTQVWLNGPTTLPFTSRSSPFNRLLVYLLMKSGHLYYEEGKIEASSSNDDALRITFNKRNGRKREQEFDEVVIRHGPNPVIVDLLPPEVIARFKARNCGGVDDSADRLWRDNFYPGVAARSPLARPSPNTAVQSFPEVFNRLYREQAVQMVGVSISGSDIKFVVREKASRKPNAPAKCWDSRSPTKI